jgi:adenylate cyclase
LLTSKEIIERTGISRATLNNYIASGLVPRPQVLPPGPEHGAAPRIGYFPDDTVERVEAIQRLKREGWSIARIAEHLTAHPPGQAPAMRGAAPAPTPAPTAALGRPSAAQQPSLSLAGPQVAHPAYLVNESFRIVWTNERARSDALSPLANRSAVEGSSVFSQLLGVDDAHGGDAILRFHLQVAQARGASGAGLFRELAPHDGARLQRLFDDAKPGEPGLVMQAGIPASGGQPARWIYAVQFREGVLFAYAPQQPGEAAPTALAARTAPAVTPVAVLVSTLQDASGLWVKLTAQEYFELLNEVWAELDRIFRRHRGRSGPQGGEVLVCYFLPQADSSYLWNALAAAHQTRDAMRQVSHRWQVRKGWDVELCMNIGIDEGQDWMGVVGATGEGGALRVVGDTADHAEQLSRVARMGAILVTRSLLGKLPGEERQRITFGVPRLEGARGDAPVLFTFARLSDMAAPHTVPARFSELAVAELLDLNSPTNPFPGPRGAG